MFKQNKGFTLIEIMVVLTILSVVAVSVIQQTKAEALRAKARILGNEIQQYNTAVRAYISYHGDTITEYNPIGVDWLKYSNPKSCLPVTDASYVAPGPDDKSFLPCGVMFDRFTFRILPKTVINPDTLVAVTVFSALKVNNEARLDLAGIAVATAAGSINRYKIKGASTPGQESYEIGRGESKGKGEKKNKIVATAGANPTLDLWLRVDGKNSMRADLDMDENDILNAGLVTGTDFKIKGREQYLSAGVEFMSIISADDVIVKPNCTPGSTAEIFVTPTSMSEGADSKAMAAVQAYAEVDGPTNNWRAKIRVLTADGWTGEAPSIYRKVLVMTRCAKGP